MQTLKGLLWFAAVLLMILSFPLQVYSRSPYPSLIPYLLISVVLLLSVRPANQASRTMDAPPRSSNIQLLVSIYLFLVAINTTWQVAFEIIAPIEGINALVVYLLPAVCYWYFRRTASENEIKFVFAAMATGGLVVGAYFAYDSYLKLALGEVSDYAQQAFQYSLERSNFTLEEANDTRIRAGFRSFGLLQSHSVSGAWVSLGAFATLALLPSHSRTIRRTVTAVFGSMVVLGLNFTAIIAFFIVIILLEFGGVATARRRGTEILHNAVPLALVVAALFGVAFWVAGDVMANTIFESFSAQRQFALGGDAETTGLLRGTLDTINAYLRHSYEYPLTLVFGDGFSTFGLPKGGDTGFVESMATFGVLFYVTILFGLLSLIMSAIRQIQQGGRQLPARGQADDHTLLKFAVCVTMLVLITDGHYSIWTAKSVLPIVFFALAIFERYLRLPRRVSFLGV